MAEDLPVADVISWDAQNFFVRYPICGGPHRHGTSGNYPSRNTRVAHCPPILGLPHQYQICFPFDTTTGRVAYWIHKEKKPFFTVGAEPEQNEVSELAEALESQLDIGSGDESLILLESGTEERTISVQMEGDEDISWTIKTIVTALSNSVLGEERGVRRFLDTSAETEILVMVKDGHGNTLLSMVAAERHPCMLTLFLDRGARINSRNKKGRTPLMEAALWGRFENTRILLARGADKEAKDREGRKAIDFTSQSEKNAEE